MGTLPGVRFDGSLGASLRGAVDIPETAPQHSATGVSQRGGRLVNDNGCRTKTSTLCPVKPLVYCHTPSEKKENANGRLGKTEETRHRERKVLAVPSTARRQSFSHLPTRACSRHVRVAPGSRHSAKCRSATSSRDCRATHTCQFLLGFKTHYNRRFKKKKQLFASHWFAIHVCRTHHQSWSDIMFTPSELSFIVKIGRGCGIESLVPHSFPPIAGCTQ